jgi:hypothetical protein
MVSVFAVLIALIPAVGLAQGVQTGALNGIVRSGDGVAVAEATVVVKSPALQGQRATATDLNGVFTLPALPPGVYSVNIAKSGFNEIQQSAVVPLGSTTSLDATLAVAAIVESVLVEGTTSSVVTSNQTSANITASEVSRLPMGRTPFLIAELMPGLTNNTPVQNQVTISGGFAFDNVFLIDGVDVNDNLLGTSNDLFIEDAIGEVQVLTSGISAEYGRFTGGVVNVITKSGGNSFAGSYRTTFTRPSWATETPFERANNIERGKPTATNAFITNKLSYFTELTAGGPIAKDRVWYFTAGRFENSSTSGTMPATAVPYTKTNDSKRYEGKVTGTLRPSHTLQGAFIDNRVHRANEPVLSFSIDRAALISPSTPNRLGVVNYSGALSPRMLLTAQYSKKDFSTVGVGGTSTDIVDSPFLTRTGPQYQYNAPYFDASDPEQRNNRQLTASLSYFVSDRRLGSHEFKGGVEHFVDTRVGANAQSSTGYVFMSNFKADAAGAPVLDGDGHPIPQFVAGTSRLQRWIPVRGSEFDLQTASAYVQDRWIASPRLTLNLGMRFENVSSDSAGSVSSVSTSRIVPRLGASYDVNADGRMVVHGTYSQYSGKYSSVIFSKNTNAGNSDWYTTVYNGPSGEGRGFAPGFDVTNYSGVAAGMFPARNVRFADDVSSPVTTEYTVGLARSFGTGAFAKAVFVQRNTSNVIDEFIEYANGRTPVTVEGTSLLFDNTVYANTDEMAREYRALQLMGQYRLINAVTVNGHWTVQLRNDGNFEGETPNPAGSPFGNYPEMLSLDRSAPGGRLDDFQRSKVRLWADYHATLGRFGSLDMTPIYRYNSAKSYSLVLNNQALSTVQTARNPGYAGAPLQPIFFGDRGSQSFESFALVDMAVTYGVPVWRSAQPWIKLEWFNVLNNQKLIAWDTTILPDAASARDEFGLPTGYLQGPRFGQGTSNAHYPGPRPGADGGRTFDVAIGFRF